jgi:hypothetical protein
MKNIKNLRIDIPIENSTNLQWKIFKQATLLELRKEYENDENVSTEFFKQELMIRWNKHKKESFVLSY